ncbi:DNA-directed RNA polymerase subunit omega [Candidatus Epulonipiscium fishelsonii]|uniref:DNA-directed RNA polymerase subunit omega n=1 Tax=Candidatus Epulonipiscium fishelsonii TaxID=77094 RepID=A0ACC8XE07_9FIRM|nr:DNA-directed RNA polymerase subunit omega [Epulopiscium sp. SCG-B05WGA-EpuloA1]ONI41060.1 DNA-directed RNA polymerase subunit omega [Epulopiscium sp. SCG-B11WGA-EpuloA1]ONI47938.1 DNA-directed RNA polymerase subunit omega [Epulopiscium sp. SCG-C06WGA-EpuloA1]
MLQPSYNQILQKLNSEPNEPPVTSRYSIIIATARRARQIIDIANETSNARNHEIIDPVRIKKKVELNEKLKRQKPISIAVDELYSGKIKIKERDNVL